MAKAASRFRSFLEKQYVSRFSRLRNNRWVPFSLSTWLVHIVRRSRSPIRVATSRRSHLPTLTNRRPTHCSATTQSRDEMPEPITATIARFALGSGQL